MYYTLCFQKSLLVLLMLLILNIILQKKIIINEKNCIKKYSKKKITLLNAI